MAVRIVEEDELTKFMTDLAQAELATENREDIVEEVVEAFENGLVLLGATAVEDKLQDDVPNTIHDLRRGGIKVWMLTGDKFETAENIGYSCKLIDEDFHVFKLEDSNQTEQFCTEANVKFNEELMKRQKDRREKLVKKN